MNIFLLTDTVKDKVDYVITSETTKADEIQDIIRKVKEELSGEWTIDDICNAMPDDVKIISCDTIYY